MKNQFFKLERPKMEKTFLSVIEAMDGLVTQSTELVSLIIEEFELSKDIDKTLVDLKRVRSDWNYKVVTLPLLSPDLVADSQVISKIKKLITLVESHIHEFERQKIYKDQNPGQVRQGWEDTGDVESITTQILISDLAKERIKELGEPFKRLVNRPDLMELDGVKRVIVCAANRYSDFVVTGVRHFCPTMRQQIKMIGLNNLRLYANGREEQGFIDQFGVFLTREEAMVIARKRGQVIIGMEHHPKQLFSEDLY